MIIAINVLQERIQKNNLSLVESLLVDGVNESGIIYRKLLHAENEKLEDAISVLLCEIL